MSAAFGSPGQDEAAVISERWSAFESGQLSAAELLEALMDLWQCGLDNEGDPPEDFKVRFAAAAKLVEDDGLRAVLQLSAFKRFPKIETLCCSQPHCFKCKVATHHVGTSCEEVQEQQQQQLAESLADGLQFCPGCGVATLKTEGCNHMICLCGENWTWEGNEVWAAEDD